MDDFNWIIDIPILSYPSIIFLREDKQNTTKNSPALQSFLHQRGYKSPMGNNRIFRGDCVGVIIESSKRYRVLLAYHDHFSPQSLVGYDIYYYDNIKKNNYITNEKVRVMKHKNYDDWYVLRYREHYWDDYTEIKR